MIDRGFGLVALCSRRARLLSVFVAAGSWRLAISKEIRRRPGAGHRAQRVGVACIRAAALRDCVTVVITPESTSPVLGWGAPNPHGDGQPDLLTLGTSTTPGLWLSPGNGAGTLSSTADIGGQRAADLPAATSSSHGAYSCPRGPAPPSLVPIPPRTGQPALIVHGSRIGWGGQRLAAVR